MRVFTSDKKTVVTASHCSLLFITSALIRLFGKRRGDRESTRKKVSKHQREREIGREESRGVGGQTKAVAVIVVEKRNENHISGRSLLCCPGAVYRPIGSAIPSNSTSAPHLMLQLTGLAMAVAFSAKTY